MIFYMVAGLKLKTKTNGLKIIIKVIEDTQNIKIDFRIRDSLQSIEAIRITNVA